jgi:hypothetical protein
MCGARDLKKKKKKTIYIILKKQLHNENGSKGKD